MEHVLDEAPGQLLLEVVQRLGHHRRGRQGRRPLERLLLLLYPRSFSFALQLTHVQCTYVRVQSAPLDGAGRFRTQRARGWMD